MGYNTRYAVKVTPDFEGDQSLDEILRKASGGYSFDCGNTECVKWYDHEDHLRALSKEWPLRLFTVTGEGEESDDLWIKYFKDGKMQFCKAQIVYPPMNLREFK
jgi:hypothetical protein